MVREQYVSTTQDSGVPRQLPDHVYKIGIYGWRKRCLYLFVLLLIIILVVNFALTIWILRVMWFNTEGMGLLQVHSDGVKLDGESEFLLPLYAQEIHSRKDASLLINASENVYLNARNENGDVTDRIAVESDKAHAHAQSLDMRTLDGDMLFQADGKDAEVGPGKLRVTGAEGALFQHSVEVPLVSGRTDELLLECPTRALSMEGPKGVVISALNGNIEVASNMDILLQSTKDGLVLDTQLLKMPNLPKSEGEVAGNAQGLYEVCVCPSGRVVVSKAGLQSTCSGSQDC